MVVDEYVESMSHQKAQVGDNCQGVVVILEINKKEKNTLRNRDEKIGGYEHETDCNDHSSDVIACS